MESFFLAESFHSAVSRRYLLKMRFTAVPIKKMRNKTDQKTLVVAIAHLWYTEAQFRKGAFIWQLARPRELLCER